MELIFIILITLPLAFILENLMDFSKFKIYRRYCGGKWELWYLDVIYSEVWFQVDEFTKNKPEIHPNLLKNLDKMLVNGNITTEQYLFQITNRPHPLCRGSVIKEEDYTNSSSY